MLNLGVDQSGEQTLATNVAKKNKVIHANEQHKMNTSD